MVTKRMTMALITQRKAPKVSKLIGIKRRLRMGFTSRFSKVKKKAAQIKTK